MARHRGRALARVPADVVDRDGRATVEHARRRPCRQHAVMTGPIYVSRLLTDRAMAHLRALGAPPRGGGGGGRPRARGGRGRGGGGGGGGGGRPPPRPGPPRAGRWGGGGGGWGG